MYAMCRYLRFASQRRAAIGRKVLCQRFELVVCVAAVEEPVLAVREDRDDETIEVGVVHLCDCNMSHV
jgi:hypothetical protein